jgi:mannan endo-1,4-beta-mannosidase
MKFTASAVVAYLASTGVALSVRELPGKKPKGFVYTDGWKFMLDGKPFLYAGTNAYWLPFLEVSNSG